MKSILTSALFLVALSSPTSAVAMQYRAWGPVPDLNGTWYPQGDPNAPCEIIQRQPDGRALFINDHGSSAWGTLQGDRVWIPDWTDGVKQGLVGVLRGNRIVWPNGTYWSRTPLYGPNDVYRGAPGYPSPPPRPPYGRTGWYERR